MTVSNAQNSIKNELCTSTKHHPAMKTQIHSALPQTTQGWGESQKTPGLWVSLGFSFCLLTASVYLPPHYRRATWNWDNQLKEEEVGGKKGWQGLWLMWMESHLMQSHLCLQHWCALRAWHLMAISSSATWRSVLLKHSSAPHTCAGKEAKLRKEDRHFDGWSRYWLNTETILEGVINTTAASQIHLWQNAGPAQT